MEKNLRIQVIMSALDKLTGPLRSIGGASSKTRNELKATHAQLAKLNQQSKLIATFRQVRGALRDVDRELVDARARANQLGQEFSKIENPTRRVTRAFNAARREVERLEQRQADQRRSLQDLRRAMKSAGMEAGSFVNHQRRIKQETDQATRALERQKDKLKELDRRQRLVARGQALGQRISDVQGKAAIGGATALGVGGAALMPFKTAGDRTRDFRSGLADIGLKAGLSRAERPELGRFLLDQAGKVNQLPSELLAGFDQLVSAGMEAKDARKLINPVGKAATAWNTAFSDVAATDFALLDKMGIKPEEIDRAHSIMSFAGKKGAFEQADMAASFPELTAAMKGLKQSGVGALADLAAGAQAVRKNTGDSATAATNLKNLLDKLTAPEVEKNFSKMGVNLPEELRKANAAGKPLLETVVDLINTATKGDDMKLGRIFGDVQARDAARALLQNEDLYRQLRTEALAARGEVDRDFADREQESANLERALEVARQVASIRAGDAVRELMDALIVPLTDVIRTVGQFAAKHPGLVKLVAAFAAMIALFGALALGAAAVLAPLAALTVVAGALGIGLLPLLGIILGIGLAIAAVVAAVLWLRANWSKLGDQWNQVWANIRRITDSFVQWFRGLPEQFKTIGRQMMEGLIAGIRFMMDPLKSTVSGVAGMLPDRMKQKLGIHSPSRVFAQIGQDTMAGLALGLRIGERGPLGGVAATAAALAAMMSPAGGAAAGPAAASSPSPSQINLTLHIHAAPGMSAEELGRFAMTEAKRVFDGLRADPLAAFADSGD